METNQKVTNALIAHDNGCNCAQSVVTQFCEDFSLDQAAAMRLASPFGGGMYQGKTCGAVTGALIVLGLRYGFEVPHKSAKLLMEEYNLNFINRFRQILGSTECNEIIGVDISDLDQRTKARVEGIFDQKCPRCIETAVRLVADLLGNQVS